MFKFLKKGPKITQICATSSGDFLFTFGLGTDGAVYVWDSVKAVWLLHLARQAEGAAAAPQAAEKK